MCGEFDEVSGIIDPVINFLAAGTLFLNSYDTLSYVMANNVEGWHSHMNSFLQENNKDSEYVSYFASITKDIIQTENIAYSGFSVRGMWSNTMVGRFV